jgi:hypothetical protein
MTQASHELEPAITLSVRGRPWPLTVDVLQAQDVAMTLQLVLEHLTRIGITAPAAHPVVAHSAAEPGNCPACVRAAAGGQGHSADELARYHE